MGGERGGFGGGGDRVEHILPLLGDGDAVDEEAERLRAPEGEKVVLNGWFFGEDCVGTVGELGPVEQQALEVNEVGKGGGDDARERVIAEIESCEIRESSNRWRHGATQLVVVKGKVSKGREGPDLRRDGARQALIIPKQILHPLFLPRRQTPNTPIRRRSARPSSYIQNHIRSASSSIHPSCRPWPTTQPTSSPCPAQTWCSQRSAERSQDSAHSTS